MRLKDHGMYKVAPITYHNPYCLDWNGFLRNYVIETLNDHRPWLLDDCKVLVIWEPLFGETMEFKEDDIPEGFSVEFASGLDNEGDYDVVFLLHQPPIGKPDIIRYVNFREQFKKDTMLCVVFQMGVTVEQVGEELKKLELAWCSDIVLHKYTNPFFWDDAARPCGDPIARGTIMMVFGKAGASDFFEQVPAEDAPVEDSVGRSLSSWRRFFSKNKVGARLEHESSGWELIIDSKSPKTVKKMERMEMGPVKDEKVPAWLDFGIMMVRCRDYLESRGIRKETIREEAGK